MPQLSNTATWRTHPQSVNGYLYLLNPDVVFRRRINQDVFVFPVTELTYDNPDAEGGSYTDIEVFQTLVIKDGDTEAIKVMTYVNFPPDEDTIPIGVLSSGDLYLDNNDIIEVWDDFRIWARHPNIDSSGNLYKDWTRVFVGASNVLPPVANGGAWYAGKIDPDAEVVTVPFDGTASYGTSGATITGYSWDVRDGTITVGTSTSSTMTATFPAGKRWVKLTVTDSNSRTGVTYILVVAADDDTALPVTDFSLTGETEWGMGFNVLSGDISGYPDGTACIFWVEEDYGGTLGSLNGQSGREHVIFTGWLSEDTTLIEPETSDWQVRAIGAAGIMRQKPAFSQTLDRPSGTASDWSQVPLLDWWRAVTFMLQWHSTLLFVTDLVRPPWYSNYPLKQLDVDAGNLASQMDYLANAVRAQFTCDHQGRCAFVRDLHLMSSAELNATTPIVSLTSADWVDGLSVQNKTQNSVALVFLYAIVPSASSIDAVMARAPGVAPGQGGNPETINSQIADQNDANVRAGRHYHFRNRNIESLEFTVNHQGLVADPAWGEPVALTIDANSNKRGISASSAKMKLRRVTISYDWNSGTETQKMSVEPIAGFAGGDGITVLMPGADAPEGEYVPQEGTWTTQALQPPQFYVPYTPYVPTVIDSSVDTAYAVAWGDDNLSLTDDGGSTWTVSDSNTDYICTSVVHDGEDPDNDTIRMWALWTDGTDTLLRFNDDVFGAGTWSTLQTFEDRYAGNIRKLAGVTDGVSILLSSSENVTQDFLDGNGNAGWTNNTSYNEFTESSGYDGVNDWYYNNGNSSADIQIYYTIPGDSPVVKIDVSIAYNANRLRVGDEVRLQIRSEDNLSVVETLYTQEGTGMGTQDVSSTATFSFSNTVNLYGFASTQSGTGYFRITAVTLYFLDNSVVHWYSDDAGVTGNDVTVANTGASRLAHDPDDFNLGAVIAAANNNIYYASAYDGSFTPLAGLTGIDGTTGVSLVRVPYTLVDSPSTLNSDKNNLQFVYGTLSEVDGATLWLVTINANTGVIKSETDITPIIAGTPYSVFFPEALETAGANTTKIFMLGVPDGGDEDDTVLLYTSDSGTTWVIRNSATTAGLRFVRWMVGSTTQAWFGGNTLLRKTADTGVTLSDASGDVSLTEVYGGYGFNVI